MTRPFSLLVKPASADCNLRCRYCFYLDKCRLYPDEARHRMTNRTLEQMIRSYLATDQPVYSFGWQGGEPTLMGLEFFRTVTDLQQTYGRPGASVANGLQTNATLVDDAMAEHLAQYRFLVGCSLDGPREVHDRYRRFADGRGSHRAVMRGVEALRRANVEFNILVLVSQANVRRAAEVYRYLTDHGFLYHQYIPCVEFDTDGRLSPFAITGDEWGEFMCTIFDLWHSSDVNRVSVRHFDSVLMKIVDGQNTVCTMAPNCCQYFVVEYGGDIYPCDFFVEPALKLGNVEDTSWEAALDSRVYREFGERKSIWNRRCTTCRFLELCCGDCVKHRSGGGRSPDALSGLCSGWKRFYEHSYDRFVRIGEAERARREKQRRTDVPAVVSRPEHPAAGRNSPCPCGSGKKFKKCCGA